MQTVRTYLALSTMALAAAGCGGGSTTGSTTTGISGLAVPQEISALPTSTSSVLPTLTAKFGQSSSALAADSDYEKAQTFKFVDEKFLDQFSILNTIFKAISQTHYADVENVGTGPYGAMVSWTEEKNGTEMKMIKSWVMNSTMESGVNHVQAWMRNMMDTGGPPGMTPPDVIKADLRITEAPTQKADGSYSDYGVWTLNVEFVDGNPNFFFAASASHGDDGTSVIQLHEKFGDAEEVKGILHKSDTAGFGKVSFPDWNSCRSDSCTPEMAVVAYVYNADYVSLQKVGKEQIYKDRNDVIDLVNRYGLFDATTGEDVNRTRSFGFPIQYTDTEGNHYGYYGAWQGRHQVWSNGGSGLPEGTTVSRENHDPNQTAPSYTTSKVFTGILVKRTLVDADIMDVKDLVVETWINENFGLQRDDTNSKWNRCTFVMNQPPTCSTEFTDFASLAYNPNDTRRNVGMDYMEPSQCQQGPCTPTHLVYCLDTTSCPLASQVPGFYVADQNNGPPTPTAQLWSGPNAGGNLWINIGGAIYISYDGSSWIQKKLLSFDQSTYTPTFDPDGDQPYTLDLDREYYINNQGGNYIVKYDGSAYDVKMELQSVANPVNATTFLSGVSYFKPQWCQSDCSTYRFETTAGDNFLKLVYDVVGTQDESSGAVSGAPVTQGQWGLMAYDASNNSLNQQFNWDYPQNCTNCGGQQQFLMDGSTYVMLDDPIRLAPVELSTSGGLKTFSLQFDGSWVSGLPEVFRDLEQNNWNFTPEIAAKVVAIPSGTEVVDATDSSKHYLFKQLQVQEYLARIADPGGLDLTEASALDLSTLPGYADSGMGAIPNVAVKYSEGVPVQ